MAAPNFASSGDVTVAELAAAYDAQAVEVLRQRPQLDGDPVRQAFDAAVVSALGLDGEMVAAIRRSLAMEAAVGGSASGLGAGDAGIICIGMYAR